MSFPISNSSDYKSVPSNSDSLPVPPNRKRNSEIDYGPNKCKINYRIMSAEEITESIQELTEPKHFCSLLLLCTTELNNQNDTNFNATNIADALERLVFFIPIVRESMAASHAAIGMLLQAALSKINDFSPPEISVVIESISALKSVSSVTLPSITYELMNLLADKVVEMIKRDEFFSTGQMTAIAQSFSLMRIIHIDLFESLARAIPFKINCFSSERLLRTLLAFSVYTIINPQAHHVSLYQTLAHRVSQKIDDYDVNKITHIAITFINVTNTLASRGVLMKILDLSYKIEKDIVEKKLSCSHEQLSIFQKMFEQQRAIQYQQTLFEAVNL